MQGDRKGSQLPTAACIDAETLAAWADGGLSKHEAALVEVHLADCERCTAMVAAFARTMPEPAAAESLWRRWHLRWLVPLATAATVAALWVLLPTPQSPQIGTLIPPTSESQSRAAANSTPASPTAVREQEHEARAAQPQQAPSSTLGTRETPAAPPQLADAKEESDKRQLTRSLNETIAAAPPAGRQDNRAEEKVADAQSERFAPGATATPASPTSAAAPAPAAGAPAAFGAESPARARNLGAAARVSSAPITLVVSPDPMTRWRVIGAGQVERSTTGGTRWEPATMPESATLIAGSSPSPSVCWLVGRSGAVYVTTDGLRFARVPFPDRAADFVSIQATDGRRATVVTIDGRSFRTEDQGTTWIRIAP